MRENKNEKDLGWSGRHTNMRSHVCIPRTQVMDSENLHIKAAAGLCACHPSAGVDTQRDQCSGGQRKASHWPASLAGTVSSGF